MKTYLLVFYLCEMPDGMVAFTDSGSPNPDVIETGIEMTKRTPMLNLVFNAQDGRVTFTKMCEAMRHTYATTADDREQEVFGKLLDTLRRVYLNQDKMHHYVRYEDSDECFEQQDASSDVVGCKNSDHLALDTIRTGAFVADETHICMVRLVDVAGAYNL